MYSFSYDEDAAHTYRSVHTVLDARILCKYSPALAYRKFVKRLEHRGFYLDYDSHIKNEIAEALDGE